MVISGVKSGQTTNIIGIDTAAGKKVLIKSPMTKRAQKTSRVRVVYLKIGSVSAFLNPCKYASSSRFIVAIKAFKRFAFLSLAVGCSTLGSTTETTLSLPSSPLITLSNLSKLFIVSRLFSIFEFNKEVAAHAFFADNAEP